MDTVIPDQLGTIEEKSRAAAQALIGRLKLTAPHVKPPERQNVAFIPVTRAQWKSVLKDADLPRLQQETDETVAEILLLRTASGTTVGKRLPELLQRLGKSVVTLSTIAGEVSRFSPSRTSAAERRLAADLAQANQREAQALFACLKQGWLESAWNPVQRHAHTAQTIARALETATRDQASIPDEDTYRRTLGLSAEEISHGSGVAVRARLLAAWAKSPKKLDRRLRQSMKHLIDDSLPLTVKLLNHLAVLALSDRPLEAHRATLLSRDLVASRLKSEPEITCSVMARHVSQERELLSSHRGQIAYHDAYNRAEHHEEKARAALDMHRAALEGDVKRTATVLLELLGRTVPPGSSLSTIRDLLMAEGEQPLCKLLSSTIHPGWRNASAHEDFRWDPVDGTLLLGGQPTDLQAVLDSAIRARTICHGFEHGVAVAYAQNPSLINWDTEESTYVSRDLAILQSAGEARFSVLDIRRQGSLVCLDVPDFSISDLREAFRVILRGSIADPDVKRWELRQSSRNRLALCVDNTGVRVGLRVSEPLWEAADPLPFAELPLMVNAMANAGESAEITASSVLFFAAAHVAGERDRLSHALTHGDSAAKKELISTARLISTGVKAAADLLENQARRKLLAFAEVLAGESHRLDTAPPWELARGFVPADRALRRHVPCLPWIAETGG
ncbi:hypothetical protein PV689_05445 [Streptomyces sp. ATCC51928]|uniref:Uncharacterized protein n=1 Tax=Streptomyces caviscabies TaxID=90079 RepID=A0ABW2M8P2_9ACTN|nr:MULTISPECIES: hypothetical protein [unclassified Streptomyces]MDX3501352.1 hypothetical protein [Streptomyces sp. ATCC51928]MDX5521530.1 hypothetical protein [Streptomyces sp. DE06-01C]